MTTVCLTWSRVSFPQLLQGQVVELVLQQATVSVQEQEQASVQEREQASVQERQRVQEQVWVQHLQRRRRQ